MQDTQLKIEDLAPHQIAALKAGRGIIVGQGVKTLSDFGIEPKNALADAQSLELAQAAHQRVVLENEQLRVRIEQLESEQGGSDELKKLQADKQKLTDDLAAAKVDLATAKSTGKKADETPLRDAVLSMSAASLEKLSEPVLKAVATAAGLDPVPDTKAAIVAALKPEEGK